MKISIALILCIFSINAIGQKYEYHIDEEYEMNANGTLNLDCDDASVTIKGSDRTKARIKVDRVVEVKGASSSDENFKIDVQEKNGDLHIREVETRIRYVMGYRSEDYKILIELPSTAGIRINGDDGDFQIENVDGTVRLDLDDSEAILSGCDGNKFDFKMDDSELEMDGGGGEVIIGTDDSEVKVKNAKFTGGFVNFDDSEIELETSLKSDSDYKISGGDGSVTLIVTGGGGTFDIRYDDGRVRSTAGFKEFEKEENYLRLKADGGDARVEINIDDTDLDLVKK